MFSFFPKKKKLLTIFYKKLLAKKLLFLVFTILQKKFKKPKTSRGRVNAITKLICYYFFVVGSLPESVSETPFTAVIKFHAKLGKRPSETFWLMQQVYGDDCLSRANVFLWHKCFLEGRERLEDNNREGRPISARTPEMIKKVRDFIANDRNASLKMMRGSKH